MILASRRKTDVWLFSFQQENRPAHRLTFEICNNCDGKLEPLGHNEAEAGVRNGCPERALSLTTDKMLAQPPKEIIYTWVSKRDRGLNRKLLAGYPQPPFPRGGGGGVHSNFRDAPCHTPTTRISPLGFGAADGVEGPFPSRAQGDGVPGWGAPLGVMPGEQGVHQ